MRIVALDIGEVRIGVAACDSLEMAAYPSGMLRRVGSLKKDVAMVADKVLELEAEMVVVGLPLSLNGDVGPQAKRVQGFGAALEKAVALPLAYWDESLTSVEADDIMKEMGASRARRKEMIDQMAAVLILDGFLEERRRQEA